MTETASKFCGCKFIRLDTADGARWHQVVACPDHELIPGPLEEVPR